MAATIVLAACSGGGGGAGTIPSGPGTNVGGVAAPASVSSHTVYLTSDGMYLNGIQPSIFAYNSAASGSEEPVNTIVNSSALGITGLATDAQGNIYASYAIGGSGPITYSEIIEYTPSGSAIRTIAGTNTDLQTVNDLAVGPDGAIYVLESAAQVGCPGLPHLLVFASTSSGNVAPTRIITGSNTDLPQGGGGALAVGPDGTAYIGDIVSSQVGNDVGKIIAYGPSQTGNVHAQTVIEGSNTQIGFIYSMAASPNGLEVDTRTDSTQEQGKVLTFPFDASGNVAPSNVLNVSKIGFQLAVDSAGESYMYSGATDVVDIFAPNATGTASPIGSFSPTIPQFTGCSSCGFSGPMAVH